MLGSAVQHCRDEPVWGQERDPPFAPFWRGFVSGQKLVLVTKAAAFAYRLQFVR